MPAPRSYPRWQHDHLALPAQRDLPLWGLPASPRLTERLFRMLAVYQGQVWNASDIGGSLGVNDKTVNSRLEYLAGAHLIRQLPPFSANLKKRLVKSPKVYWRDTGLLHALWNVRDDRALMVHPHVGASWEGFCVEQILRALSAEDVACDASYFRTSDGHEIDLVLDFGEERWAVEMKLTASPHPEDLERLARDARLIGAHRSWLVSQTRNVVDGGDRVSCNLPAMPAAVSDMRRR